MESSTLWRDAHRLIHPVICLHITFYLLAPELVLWLCQHTERGKISERGTKWQNNVERTKQQTYLHSSKYPFITWNSLLYVHFHDMLYTNVTFLQIQCCSAKYLVHVSNNILLIINTKSLLFSRGAQENLIFCTTRWSHWLQRWPRRELAKSEAKTSGRPPAGWLQ